MSANKKNKNNINYFKKKDQIKVIGGGLLIVGLFMLWLQMGIISWILAPVFIPVGFGMFLYGSIVSSSEGDIDEAIAKNSRGLEVDFSEDRHYNNRIINEVPPKVAEGYEYEGGGLMYRKDKRGTWRSSKYTKAIIYVLVDELYINIRTFSLTSDEVDTRFCEIPFEAIESIELKREERAIVLGKNIYKVTKPRFVVKYGECEILNLPINDDIKTEEFVEMLNKMTKSQK